MHQLIAKCHKAKRPYSELLKSAHGPGILCLGYTVGNTQFDKMSILFFNVSCGSYLQGIFLVLPANNLSLLASMK